MGGGFGDVGIKVEIKKSERVHSLLGKSSLMLNCTRMSFYEIHETGALIIFYYHHLMQ
jgi:hypothetical protein